MGRMKLETTRSGNAIKVAAAQGCRRGLAAFEGMSPAAGETCGFEALMSAAQEDLYSDYP